MVATIEDFHRYLHTEVTLPVSGLIVAIRRPDQMALLRLGELLIPSVPVPAPAPLAEGEVAVPPAAPAITPLEYRRLQEAIVATGVINPPMADTRNDQGNPVYSTTKVYLHVAELDAGDFACLFQAISAKMGLTTEDAKAVQAFRPDAQREADQSPRRTLSAVAE